MPTGVGLQGHLRDTGPGPAGTEVVVRPRTWWGTKARPRLPPPHRRGDRTETPLCRCVWRGWGDFGGSSTSPKPPPMPSQKVVRRISLPPDQPRGTPAEGERGTGRGGPRPSTEAHSPAGPGPTAAGGKPGDGSEVGKHPKNAAKLSRPRPRRPRTPRGTGTASAAAAQDRPGGGGEPAPPPPRPPTSPPRAPPPPLIKSHFGKLMPPPAPTRPAAPLAPPPRASGGGGERPRPRRLGAPAASPGRQAPPAAGLGPLGPGARRGGPSGAGSGAAGRAALRPSASPTPFSPAAFHFPGKTPRCRTLTLPLGPGDRLTPLWRFSRRPKASKLPWTPSPPAEAYTAQADPRPRVARLPARPAPFAPPAALCEPGDTGRAWLTFPAAFFFSSLSSPPFPSVGLTDQSFLPSRGTGNGLGLCAEELLPPWL